MNQKKMIIQLVPALLNSQLNKLSFNDKTIKYKRKESIKK